MRSEVYAALARIKQMRADSNDHDGGYPATVEGRRQSLHDHAAVAEWYMNIGEHRHARLVEAAKAHLEWLGNDWFGEQLSKHPTIEALRAELENEQ